MPPVRNAATITSVVGGVMGVLLLVIGLVALARTGIPAEALTEPTASVGPFTRTPLMAIIEIIFGLLVVVGAATVDRGTLTGLGLIGIVFGLVWLIEPGAFQAALGVGRSTGILYFLVGLVCVVVGLLGTYGRGTVIREETRPM